jgi:hypothetical protein
MPIVATQFQAVSKTIVHCSRIVPIKENHGPRNGPIRVRPPIKTIDERTNPVPLLHKFDLFYAYAARKKCVAFANPCDADSSIVEQYATMPFVFLTKGLNPLSN